MFAPVSVGQLSTRRHEQLRDITLRNWLRTHSLDRLPALGERLLRLIDSIVQRTLGFIWSAQHQVASCLKLEHQSMEILQQRVVQFSRNASALTHARFQPDRKLVPQFPNTESIESPEQCQKSSHARYTEPGGLVVGRGDGEIQECAGLVPHTAIVAGGDAEAVVAGREIGIERLPAGAHVTPIAILAFQLEAKKDLFRRDEAERGIVDLQMASLCGQAQAR